MLLWTIQNKVAQSVIEDGIWYSTNDYRMKRPDYDLIQEDVKLPNGKVADEVYPVYTYASVSDRFITMLGMRAAYSFFNHWVGFMQFRVSDSVLLELDVPEDEILNAKYNSKWYVKHLPGWKEAKHFEKWKYEADEDFYTIAKRCFVSYTRNERSNDAIECVLPCIKKEWVVAIREFNYIKDNGGYGTCALKTAYVKDGALPTFTETLYLNGDGYPHMADGSVLKGGGIDKVGELQDKFGMDGCYSYFTLEEAADVVNGAMWEAIRLRAKKLGWEYKTDKGRTVSELFGTDKHVLTAAEASAIQ